MNTLSDCPAVDGTMVLALTQVAVVPLLCNMDPDAPIEINVVVSVPL